MQSPLFKKPSQWPILGEYDVAVIGAGPGGIGAAVSAARLGMKTILIEKYGFPGGAATLSNTPLYMGFSLDNKQIVGGLSDEMVRELDSLGMACFVLSGPLRPEYAAVGNRPLTHHVLSTVETIRIVSNRILERAGVTRLFFSSLIGAAVEDGQITAAAIACVDGLGLIRAKCFIDGTGDAQLVHMAGGQVRQYSGEELMHKSLFFDVAGVEPYDDNENRKLYQDLHAAGKTPPDAQSYFAALKKLEPGMVQMCLNKAVGDGLSSAELTRMDMEMREQIPAIVDFLRREMPGFSRCFLASTSVHVGVRAGRGIVGVETLTKDYVDSGCPTHEPIVLINRSYGSHSTGSGFVPPWQAANEGVTGVPFRTIIPVDFKNVLAAGRSISLDPRILDTVRLMPRCMTIGQAAGTCAALSVKAGYPVSQVDYAQVRNELLQQKVILSP